MQDEVKALQLCQNKVRQKKLPMDVVDAEYQWSVSFFFWQASVFAHLCCRDRRKLTFYFVADKRIDFRELVRELFRCVHSISCYQMQSLICHVDCTKQGFGWHPSRVLLAWSSDHISSVPFHEPQFFSTLPYFVPVFLCSHLFFCLLLS